MRQIEVQVDFQSDYRISEAFKTLRTNILFCGADHKVIMVTSCLQSDGKTTVSFGIAKAFADDGHAVAGKNLARGFHFRIFALQNVNHGRNFPVLRVDPVASAHIST